MTQYVLKLYICGRTQRSRQALENLHRICQQALAGNFTLEVIDVLEEPERAEADKILATPTVVKLSPLPRRQIVGDLSSTEQVLLGLEVSPNLPGKEQRS